MKVETEYNIGDKVWVVYECNGEVNVYSDIIDSIMVTEEGIIMLSPNHPLSMRLSELFDTTKWNKID